MATLQEQLTLATAAYSRLISGGAATVYVDQNGERIEYQTGSAPRLLTWIYTLQSQIAQGSTDIPALPQRPMRPVF